MHRLRYFLSIAEAGSMTQAATVLGIAQPALSRQVRLLEEDLGVTLFHRTSRGVRLTEEGEWLCAAATGPLRQIEQAIKYVGSPLAHLERGLHLGLPPTAAGILAAPLLASVGAAFPRASLELTVAHPDDLVEGMLKGSVDVAVINAVADDRLFYRDLLEEDLVIIGGPASDLRPSRPVSFAELADRPLVLPASRTGIRSTVENTALRRSLRIQSRHATDSVETAKYLVEAGLVHGVLPISACDREIKEGRLRYAPLHEPTLTHRLVAATAPQVELPGGLRAKIGDIIREEAARLTSSGAWPARFLAPHPWA
jgi:LysR family transcriptional regulator, nitrogen assimilation regulatory protein